MKSVKLDKIIYNESTNIPLQFVKKTLEIGHFSNQRTHLKMIILGKNNRFLHKKCILNSIHFTCTCTVNASLSDLITFLN